jgi:hypothetical protein
MEDDVVHVRDVIERPAEDGAEEFLRPGEIRCGDFDVTEAVHDLLLE